MTVRQKAGGVRKGMGFSSNLNRHLQYTSPTSIMKLLSILWHRLSNQ